MVVAIGPVPNDEGGLRHHQEVQREHSRVTELHHGRCTRACAAHAG
ncbi:MAG: hypothetical protein MZV70_57640 [Desulfobacterales bacterium]|nr:hypothetical protein [Desulfobacterales bacterium]